LNFKPRPNTHHRLSDKTWALRAKPTPGAVPVVKRHRTGSSYINRQIIQTKSAQRRNNTICCIVRIHASVWPSEIKLNRKVLRSVPRVPHIVINFANTCKVASDFPRSICPSVKMKSTYAGRHRLKIGKKPKNNPLSFSALCSGSTSRSQMQLLLQYPLEAAAWRYTIADRADPQVENFDKDHGRIRYRHSSFFSMFAINSSRCK
jgi:hypothetical protein